LFHLKSRVPGQKPILRESSLDRLHTPSELRAEGESLGEARMGMGWGVVDLDGVRFVIASGAAPGTMSRLTLIPASNVAVALLCNASLPDEFALWKIEWETFAALVAELSRQARDPGEQDSSLRAAPGAPRRMGGQRPNLSRDFAPEALGPERPGNLDRARRTPRRPDAHQYAPRPTQIPEGLAERALQRVHPTGDAQRSPHVVFLRLKLQGDVLAGTVSAVAVDKTFALPIGLVEAQVLGRVFEDSLLARRSKCPHNIPSAT